MKTSAINSLDLFFGDLRMDASYHASSGQYASHILKNSKVPIDHLDQVCQPGGIFIPGRFRRVYIDNPENGLKWLSPTDMQKADLSGLAYVSSKYTSNLNTLRLHKGWVLLSRSGTIGNLTYVRADMEGLIGSDDIIRIVADPKQILSGYLYAVLYSPLILSLIKQKTYGAVIPHIETNHVIDLPIPRLNPIEEERIHQLIEQAADLRVKANQFLRLSQERFFEQVLGIDSMEITWKCRNEHAYVTDEASIDLNTYRLDSFHYVGYVKEAELKLNKAVLLEELAEPYQPPQFKRPYTDNTGVPFLSGIDLFNNYPKPRIFISSKMKGLEQYRVSAGTILIQSDGSRDGLIARPTILPNHLDHCAVTQHMARLYPKDLKDRGFIYVWLSTEIGRRLLLKHSSGSVMGSLFEKSYRQVRVPYCQTDLRFSFEIEIQKICSLREKANSLEDEAQKLLYEYLGIQSPLIYRD